MDKNQSLEFIKNIFEEQVLVLGGVFSLHEVADEIIWKIIKSFDVIYEKAVAEILQIEPDTQELPSRKANPHPAIEHFLAKLRH